MKFIAVIVVLLCSLETYGGDSIPKFKFSAGFGVPNLVKYSAFFKVYEGYPGYHSNGLGPFHLKAEYMFKNWLGLGINANYMSYNIYYTAIAFDPSVPFGTGSVPNEVKISNSSTTLNLRANYYFIKFNNRHKKSEMYAGFGIGYKFWNFDVTSQYPDQTPTVTFSELYDYGLEASFGYRYRIKKHLAVYSEIGLAKSILQFGITGSF